MAARREVVYSHEVPECVALYIREHGGMITTERVDPAWVFHKVTLYYDNYRRTGGSDQSPIFLYTLADGGQLLIQYITPAGAVPGHEDSYWTTIYIYKQKRNGDAAARTETT